MEFCSSSDMEVPDLVKRFQITFFCAYLGQILNNENFPFIGDFWRRNVNFLGGAYLEPYGFEAMNC